MKRKKHIRRKKVSKYFGFTLIELLTAVAIGSVIIGVGLVRFRDFNETQSLKSAGETFKNNLRDMQVQALAQNKPAVVICDPPAELDGYQIDYIDTSTYQSEAYCDSVGTGQVRTYTLPANIIFIEPFTSFQFLTLARGVNTTTTITLSNTNTNTCYRLTISIGGDIQDEGLISCPISPTPVASPQPSVSPTPLASPLPTPQVTPPPTPQPSPTPTPLPTPTPTPAANLITNPSFSSNTTGWTFFYSPSRGGSGSLSRITSGTYSSPGSARATITTSPTDNNVQLYQQGLTLQPYTNYRLTFAAKSNTGHDLRVSVLKHTSPFTNYGLSSYYINLTSSWQLYTVDFTTANFATPVSDGRLMFFMGNYDAPGDQYFYDDVSLTPL